MIDSVFAESFAGILDLCNQWEPEPELCLLCFLGAV